MSSVSGSSPRRSSRLLDLARHLSSQAGGSRVGFLSREATPARRALLIASLPRLDVAAVTAAVSAGADAVEIRTLEEKDRRGLRAALAGIAVPVGIEVSGDGGMIKAAEAAEAGIDWLRMQADVSIGALDWEKAARMLTLPNDLDLRLVAALSALEIDAVLVDLPARSDISLADGLRLRAIAELAKKPLFLHGDWRIPATVLAASDHLGVDGIVVDIEDASRAGGLATLAAALKRAPSGA
jgi:hypothetical protein